MKFRSFVLLLISVTLFNACDLLRLSKFEVISWTPGGGYHMDTEKIIVSLSFSRNPDRASVERNFSLTGNGNRVRGNFLWEGNKMIFSSLSALEENTDYIINLSADAHDTGGLSMDYAFYEDFTTRSGNERPALLSYYPNMFMEIDDPKAEIILQFSVPIPIKTLYDNVSFSPSMTGFWFLTDEGKTAVFSPAESWTQNTRYEVHVSSSLTDNRGLETGKDFKSVFNTGTDHKIPSLAGARRISIDGSVNELISDSGFFGAEYTPIENSFWEKDDKLSLVFSKPVDSASVKNAISADDGPNIVMETVITGFHTEVIFRFDNPLVYESRFTLRIKKGIKDEAQNESNEEYIFKIFADGKSSKPPELIGLRMPMAPGNNEDQESVYFGIDSVFDIIHITNNNYPSGESVNTWIELYFSAADGASIDLFSVMELFRIETSNNVIAFSPRLVKLSNKKIIEPLNIECLNEVNYQRVEITGNLVNSTSYGIINFIIAPGLTDTFGNKNNKTFKISLVK